LNSKSKYAILLLSSVLVIYAVIGGMLGRVNAQNGSYQQLSIFMEVLNRIQNDYVDEPSLKNAVQGAIRGMVEVVDPYGGLLSAKEAAFYREFNLQKTPGIGVILARRAGYPVVVSAIPGGPAARAGLSYGDFIESIDGHTTREMNLVQIHALLASPADKPVSLVVIRRDRAEPETLDLSREMVQAPPVEARMLENTVGYVHVPLLAPGKALEAKKQLDDLLKKGATSVLLDLRFTAGGEEKEALELANLFVDSGTIGFLEGQQIEKTTFTANPRAALTKSPMVVLVNQGTSGAAELVAAAIADNQRGQLVGTKTFGFGSVQKLIPLEDGSSLLISVAKYYTPLGKEIQDGGIKPTVEVGQPADEIFDPNAEDQPEVQPPASEQKLDQDDRQLKKALELLKDSTAARQAA
jgi:carboxyl-terminal processing protease